MAGETGFYWDERCFWHAGHGYAYLSPIGGHVQPLVSGGLPEAPETKRRALNLLRVTGLAEELQLRSASPLEMEDLRRVHEQVYLDQFKAMSDAGGGELGLRTPFGPGAFEIANLSAGLIAAALEDVLHGDLTNAYALTRPPGHHCLPAWPNGFCLLNNIAIAIAKAKAAGLAERFAVIDWDVHHGNGTEHIYYNEPNVLTVSLHQDRCYPFDTGFVEMIGDGPGEGANVNVPLQPGAGHLAYLSAMEKIVLPKLHDFQPDIVIVACGFDASGADPLSRMMCTSNTFRQLTQALLSFTGGKVVMAHEGGYSEVHVPFCCHAVLEEMSGSTIRAEDPMAARLDKQQPSARIQEAHDSIINEIAEFHRIKSG